MRSGWLGALCLMFLLGCVSSDRPARPPVSTIPEPPELRERGLLLLMSDRRYYDSFSIGSIRFENPDLHAQLALSLGRIGDDRGVPLLQSMLVEGSPEVRREAAFSLGLMADRGSVPHLLGATSDADLETALWAVAGLAELEVDARRVQQALTSQSENARWARLSPYLFRFPPEQIQDLAAGGLRITKSDTRAMSGYALARNPQLESVDLLRSLAADRDPWLRAWAARSLGQVGDRTDMERLLELLEDPEPGPVIQALRAGRRLVASGMAAPPAAWRPRLLTLFTDPRPGVALTALEASAGWLLDDSLGDALEEVVRSGSPRRREVALMALAEGGDPRAFDRVTRMATASDERQRRHAAEVAARLQDVEILRYLSLDDSPLVRGAAVAGLLDRRTDESVDLALRFLEDEDPGIRALVMEWLVESPVAPADLVSRAIIGPGNREVTGLRLNGVRALLARGQAEPLERGLVVENLESLARVGEYPARLAAARALAELDRPQPQVAPAGSGKNTNTYMQVVLQTDKDHAVTLETSRGALRVELECRGARMTCLNFLQLARQGFYDGQSFHRVIPDFVVQTGDPRGDGWGGPGYTIRDELQRTRFERGVLGMASSGADTAGSQFFITLSRQPHLDGRYSAFGRVVEGLQILDALEQGDRLERVTVVR